MTKYHIDKNGKPAICKATKRPCPLGGDDVHFSTEHEAQAYIDNKNAGTHGVLAGNAVREIVNNVPEYANKYKLLVARNIDGEKWFHGAFNTHDEILKAYENDLTDYEIIENTEQTQAHIDEQKGLSATPVRRLTPAQERKQLEKEKKEKLRLALMDRWNNDEDMVKYILKTHHFLEMDGTFIEVAQKPNITSRLYFRDDVETPKLTYELFYNYNMREAPVELERTGRRIDGTRGDLILAPMSRGGDLSLTYPTYEISETDGETYITLNDQEFDEINKSIREARKAYEKRLKSYYNRYKDKITIATYWADR